jgi:H+/gluconate symporter-like permease
MPFFGTTTYAAPGLGIIGTVLMFGFGMWWLSRRAKSAKAQGEGYLPLGQTENVARQSQEIGTKEKCLAFLPLVIVIVSNYILSEIVLPNLSAEYLSQPLFGNTTLVKVKGIWGLTASVGLGIVVAFLVYRKKLTNPIKSLNEGTMGSMLPIFNTASEVGYGKVIASLPAFAVIKGGLLGFFPQYPALSISLAVNGLAGITGSASGGLSIALEALGKSYMEMAQLQGLNPEVLHRVASMSSGGLDTLPHNGAVITLLAICGLTHKSSYLDIFMVSCFFTVLTTFIVVAISIPLGSF